MAGKVFELQGYAIVLDKVVFLTRVFEAEDGEGYQFNIRGAQVRDPARGRPAAQPVAQGAQRGLTPSSLAGTRRAPA
jgi:hypothetical protein